MKIRPILIVALALSTMMAGAEVFTSNTTIGVGDVTYDGQPIVVSNCTLTVNGPHSFASLLLASNAVLTHDRMGQPFRINVLSSAVVGTGASINVDGAGYIGNSTNLGPGIGGVSSINGCIGGAGHGGDGGQHQEGGGQGAGYGSYWEPMEFGSASQQATGSGGGGSVRLAVGGTLTVDGTITAGGLGASAAGGSVYLTCAVLAGGGAILARGADADSGCSGGGGGGRLALVADTISFSGSLSAVGGTGFQAGGAGTIYTRLTGESVGRLLLDNAGRVGYTRFASTNWPADQRFALTLAGSARLAPLTPITVSQLDITTGAMLTHDRMGQPLRINVLGSAVVGTGASINVDGAGYYGANLGSGRGGGSSLNVCKGGAGHGGDGGQHQESGGQGAGYGSYWEPMEFGSATFGNAGSGGGSVRLAVGGTLTVDGTITAGGQGASAAGGSVYLTCAELAGGGAILARGADADSGCSGGGGGGRLALVADTISFSGSLSAVGGTGFQAGGAGTIYTRLTGESVGRLLLDNAGRVGYTRFASTNWPADQRFALTLAGSARLAPLTPITVSQLDITTGAMLTHDRMGQPLRINVLGSAVVGTGASINVDGAGYYGANRGPGRGGGSSYNECQGGAGYGGLGGQQMEGGGRGPTYGSYLEPMEFGSVTLGNAGSGGGAVRLAVGGTLTVDGTITAGGQGPSAAGGSVYLTCAVFAGGGDILAQGSAAPNGCSGGGGGGRIAVHAGTMSFLGTQSVAGGGDSFTGGGVGTIYLTNSAALGGSVRTATQQGLAGARVTATGGYSTFTDAQGGFVLLVPADWSGSVVVTATNQIITPDSRALANVSTPQFGVDFIAEALPQPPVITSASSATGQVGQVFGYQITASNNPTLFSAFGLPGGLTVNTNTGVISGTPTAAGSFSAQIMAANAGGTNTASLNITIQPPTPVITSANSATGRVWQTFSYQITADNAPSVFGATGLPSGLSVNTTNGLISGTPTIAGSFAAELSAGNQSGTNVAPLALTIAPAQSLVQTNILQPGPGANDGTDDGSLTKGKDASNAGASSPVLPLYNSPCNLGLWPGYVQFATANMPTQDVIKVEVQIYCKMFFNGSGWAWPATSYQISVRQVTTPWNELTLPTGVAPTPLASNIVTTVGGGTPGFIEFEGWLSFDITGLYRNWAAGTVTNCGLQFALDTSYCANGDEFYIYSSDNTNAAWRPKLIVQSGPSRPMLSVSAEAGNLRLSWNTKSGPAYQVYSAANFINWSPYGPLRAGTGGVLTQDCPMTNSPGLFFRVETGN